MNSSWMTHRWSRVVGFLVVAAACAGAPLSAGHLEEVRSNGKLVMLCWPHQESQFVRRMVEELGAEGLDRFAGIDVELMEAFADHLGVELEVRPVTAGFGRLLPTLLDGEGDLVASSLTITEERRRLVEFSVPYFEVKGIVLARRDSGISSIEDLRGKVAAAVPGSSHEERIRALGYEDLRFHAAIDFTLESYQAVAYGEADFTLVDSGSVSRVMPKYSELRKRLHIAFEFPQPETYGIALRKGSDLLPVLDAFLEGKRARGELEEATPLADWEP